jgi:hypothetical protein
MRERISGGTKFFDFCIGLLVVGTVVGLFCLSQVGAAIRYKREGAKEEEIRQLKKENELLRAFIGLAEPT